MIMHKLLFFFTIASYVFAPLEEVYACPGEQVALTCQTNNYSLLEWQIVVPEHQRIEHRYISASLVAGYLTKLQINSTVFNFSRTSEYETAPLVSTLLISYIAADLNQTLVYCSELGHLYENRVFAAKIYVIERSTFLHCIVTVKYIADSCRLALSPGSPIFSACNIENMGIGPGNEAMLHGFRYLCNKVTAVKTTVNYSCMCSCL